MAFIHWVVSSFFPEKSARRAAFCSAEQDDMMAGAEGTGVTGGAGVAERDEASGSGVEVVGS